MLSMTGYGSGSAALGRGKVVVEARGVNHRFLDVLVRFPPEIERHAGASEATARALMRRGRIEITARSEGPSSGEVYLDRERARAAYQAVAELRDELRPGEPIPLCLLASVPDLFGVRKGVTEDDVRAAVQTATQRACEQLTEMRTTEGLGLASDLKNRLELVREHVRQMRGRSPAIVESRQNKLRERMEKLFSDAELSPDPGRLEHEVAIWADRMDTSEELTRLAGHCDHFEALMKPGPEPAGRRMGFLIQEMVREANTIGSKIQDLEITNPVIELKAELERMREQVQNVL